jgi:hypothetical protein
MEDRSGEREEEGMEISRIIAPIRRNRSEDRQRIWEQGEPKWDREMNKDMKARKEEN